MHKHLYVILHVITEELPTNLVFTIKMLGAYFSIKENKFSFKKSIIQDHCM